MVEFSLSFVFLNASGIREPSDLINKTIGVPFGSTSHLQLLYVLHNVFKLGNQVHVEEVQPSRMIDMWEAGKIDGFFVWSPTLDILLQNGARTFIGSTAILAWDISVFIGLLARTDGQE